MTKGSAARLTRGDQRRRALRERREREARLPAGVICDRCGATVETYDLKCTAELDDACPGFAAIEAAIAEKKAPPCPS